MATALVTAAVSLLSARLCVKLSLKTARRERAWTAEGRAGSWSLLLFKSEFKLRQTALGVKNKLHLSPHLAATGLRPTPLSVEIVFHSESGICTIVSQPCFTTRNLRTKLCGIRSQTQKQEFVDPFKSWYLETRSDPEMENRLACGKHFSHKDSTKIWNGLYCITWNTILRIPDPESKTIFWEGGVGRKAW